MIDQHLIENDAVQLKLAAASSAQDAFRKLLSTFEHILNPKGYADAHAEAIKKANTPEKIIDAAIQWAAVSGPALDAAQGRAKAICAGELEQFKAKLIPLLDTAEDVLAQMKCEAIKSEEEFFASHGMRREPTSVSIRFGKPEARLIYFRQCLTESQARSSFDAFPNKWDNILSYFRGEEQDDVCPNPQPETDPEGMDAADALAIMLGEKPAPIQDDPEGMDAADAMRKHKAA